VTYPIALTTHAGPQAQRFDEFVTGDAAKAIFRKFGFSPVR
jgi:ABC-type molybdate transport system substrate-binding protein